MLTPEMNLLEIEHQHVCEIIIQVLYRLLGRGWELMPLDVAQGRYNRKMWYEAHFQRKTATIT